MSKLTGDPKIDFPEMYENEVDNSDEYAKYEAQLIQVEVQNDFIKRNIIEEVKENVEVKGNSIYDKRLRRPLLKRIYDALFGK
jgi:hypothetical protein